MSTLKADAITSASSNTDIVITGAGSGVPDIEASFKVGGTAGVPVSALRAGTDGELITWAADASATTVAVGTATHVLTSNGVGVAPTFQAAGGGGAWTHISRAAPSSAATVDFTGFNASSYDSYVFVWDLLGATDNKYVRVRLSTDGGSSFADGSEYRYVATYQLSNATTPTGTALTGTNSFNLDGGYGAGNAANEGTAGVFWIYAPDAAVYTKVSFLSTSVDQSGNHLSATGSGHLMLASDVDAVRFMFSSGNIASGEINMYGVKNSS